MDPSLQCHSTLRQLLRRQADPGVIGDSLELIVDIASKSRESDSSSCTALACDLIASCNRLRLSERCHRLYRLFLNCAPASSLIQAFHLLLSKRTLYSDVVHEAANLFAELFVLRSARLDELFSESFEGKKRNSCCVFLVSALAAIPTMFSNAGQGILHPDLVPEAFFSKTCAHAANFIKAHHCVNKFMMAFFAKLARIGMAKVIVDYLVSPCLLPYKFSKLFSASDFCIIFEKIATYGLSSASDACEVLQSFLPFSLADSHDFLVRSIMRLFSDKVLSKVSMHAVIQYLSQQTNRSSFVTVFEETVSVWSTSSLAKKLSIPQHASLSQAVVLFLEKSNQSELNSSSSAVSAVLTGIQNRLCSPTAEIRIMGMRIGEALSLKLTPDQPLIFSQDDEDRVTFQEMQIIFGKDLDLRTSEFKPAAPPTLQSVKTNDFLVSESQNLGWINENCLPDDEEFCSVEGAFALNATETCDDDSIPSKPVRTPYFLRECLDYLSEKKPFDSREYFEIALESIPKVVQAAPNDLGSLSLALALQVLRLHNKFGDPKFDHLQKEALVAIISSSPGAVGPRLIQVFSEPNHTISTRLLVLDAIAETAKALSAVRVLHASFEDSKASKLVPIRQIQSTLEEVSIRLENKTRRWSRAISHPVPVSNKFASYAEQTLYILISQVEKKNLPFRLFTDDALILTRLLQVSGIIVDCGGISAHFNAAIDCLFRLIWRVKDHDAICVRIASLFALSRILSVKCTFISIDEDASKYSDVWVWLTSAADHDPNIDVRNLALFSLTLLSKNTQTALR